MTGRRYWMKWLGWWKRPPARPRADDFGDFGTAFGLDLSLEHQRRTPEAPTTPPASMQNPSVNQQGRD